MVILMVRASMYGVGEEGGHDSAYNTWSPQNFTYLQLVSSMIFPQHHTLIIVDVADIFDIPHPYHPLTGNDSTHSVGSQSLVYIIQSPFSDHGYLVSGWNNLVQSGSLSSEGLKLGHKHSIGCLNSLDVRVQTEAFSVRWPSSSMFKEKLKKSNPQRKREMRKSAKVNRAAPEEMSLRGENLGSWQFPSSWL